MPEPAPGGRSVKSGLGRGAAGAANRHERVKDSLRDQTCRFAGGGHLLLMKMFRHGLRVSEAVSLRLDELDLNRSMPWVH